jgi:hypothetical protein
VNPIRARVFVYRRTNKYNGLLRPAGLGRIARLPGRSPRLAAPRSSGQIVVVELPPLAAVPPALPMAGLSG